MYKYLCSMEKEKKRRPKMDYMKVLQKDITPLMRGHYIDWLAKVADDYNLLPDVLYLAVSYIDRYLSFHPVRKINLQLLCVTSMYIASKYEDISTHNVENFSVITCNFYNKEEVLEMENKILKTLDFDLSTPTTRTFLRQDSAKLIFLRFNEITREENNDSSWKFKLLTEYLGELSLLEYECLMILPSLVAASITLLARFIVWPEKRPCWVKLNVVFVFN
ncbi:putative cyclin-A3-1 [Trifolium repens]|nr:putative cyclin-A3-1 [Trifolium repens]